MSNLGIRLLLSMLHPGSVFDFFVMYEGFGWEDCAASLCYLSLWTVTAAGIPSDLRGRPRNTVANTWIFWVLGECARAGRLLGTVARHVAWWDLRLSFSLPPQARKERNHKEAQKDSKARQPLLPIPVRVAPDSPCHQLYLMPRCTDAFSLLPAYRRCQMHSLPSLMVLLWQGIPGT